MVQRTARGLLVVVLIGGAIVVFVVLVSVAHLLDALIPTDIPAASVLVSILRSVLVPCGPVDRDSPGHLSDAAGTTAAVALGAHPRDRRRHRRRAAQPGVHAARAATGRRRGAGGLAGVRVHRPGMAVVHVPGAAVRRRVGQGPRRRPRIAPDQVAWGVPHRRQNRALAESDSPQLRHGWIPPLTDLPGINGRGNDFPVRLCPEGIESALRRGLDDSGTADRSRYPPASPAIAVRRSGRRSPPRAG